MTVPRTSLVRSPYEPVGGNQRGTSYGALTGGVLLPARRDCSCPRSARVDRVALLLLLAAVVLVGLGLAATVVALTASRTERLLAEGLWRSPDGSSSREVARGARSSSREVARGRGSPHPEMASGSRPLRPDVTPAIPSLHPQVAPAEPSPGLAPLLLVRLPTSRTATVLAYVNVAVAVASLACAIIALVLDLGSR